MSGIVSYGINKIYSAVVTIISFVVCALNLYLTIQFYADIKNRCNIENENVCLGSQPLVKGVIFYTIVAIHSIILVYLLWRLPHIKIALKTSPYCYYLTRNKFIYVFQFMITILKILINLLFVVALCVQVSTGYNENFRVGNTFYVPEVRAAFYSWINYVAFFLIIALWILTNLIIKVSEQFFASAIFSQWYFNRNKHWVRNSNKNALKQLRYHLGSFIKYALVVFWAHKVCLPLEKIKFYLDSIELAKNRHKVIIVLVKPLVYMYERYFKYQHGQLIYDIAIFGKSVQKAGFRSYYLKFRNWTRYGTFYRGFGTHSFAGILLLFNAIYLFVLIWIAYIRVSFYETVDFTSLSYLIYYPMLFAMFFSFIFSEACSLLNTSYELLVFCFVADEEMYQNDQKYCDDELLSYVNSLSTPNEKAYMKKIINEKGVTKKLDENFGKLIAKKVKKEELEDAGNYNNENDVGSDVAENDNNEDMVVRVNEPTIQYKAEYVESDMGEDDEPKIITDRDQMDDKYNDGEEPTERRYSNIDEEEKSIKSMEEPVVVDNNKAEASKLLEVKGLQPTNRKHSIESINEEGNLIEYIRRKKDKIKRQNMEYLKNQQKIERSNIEDNNLDANEYMLDPNSIAATMLKQLKKKPVKKEEDKHKIVVKSKANPDD